MMLSREHGKFHITFHASRSLRVRDPRFSARRHGHRVIFYQNISTIVWMYDMIERMSVVTLSLSLSLSLSIFPSLSISPSLSLSSLSL